MSTRTIIHVIAAPFVMLAIFLCALLDVILRGSKADMLTTEDDD